MRHIIKHLNANQKINIEVTGLGFSVNEITPFSAKVYYLIDHKNETVNQLIGRNIKFSRFFKTFTIINTEEYPVDVDFYIMENEEDFKNLMDPSLFGLRKVDTERIQDWRYAKIKDHLAFYANPYDSILTLDTSKDVYNGNIIEIHNYKSSQLGTPHIFIEDIQLVNKGTASLSIYISQDQNLHKGDFAPEGIPFNDKYISSKNNPFGDYSASIIKGLWWNYLDTLPAFSFGRWDIGAGQSFKMSDWINQGLLIEEGNGLFIVLTNVVHSSSKISLFINGFFI